jgi:predicted phosphodiesterase
MERLFRDTREINLKDDDRIVIFSDLHMGNGGMRDDFLHNAPLFKSAMERFYTPSNFDLILNGDIEELHKFLMKSISSTWPKIFTIFREMEDRGGLHKVLGNHDSEKWLLGARYPVRTEPRDSLRLNYHGNRIFLLHGHQAGLRQDRLESLTHFILRYGARPLAINNFAVSNNATRKYLIENRVYNFAKERKIMAIIGHTHRPLFESQSKVDYLKFRIEQMLREYPAASGEEKLEIERKIITYRNELKKVMKLKRKEDFLESLYHDGPVVPCLFNSGCAVGKRGITALEIEDGSISLVYWFDKNKSQKYFNFNGYKPERVEGDIYRVILKNAPLKYIFSRIRLLS